MSGVEAPWESWLQDLQGKLSQALCACVMSGFDILSSLGHHTAELVTRNGAGTELGMVAAVVVWNRCGERPACPQIVTKASTAHAAVKTRRCRVLAVLADPRSGRSVASADCGSLASDLNPSPGQAEPPAAGEGKRCCAAHSTPIISRTT